jgi:flagellar assembly protein FliH
VEETAEPEIDLDALRAEAWNEGHAAGVATAGAEIAPAVAALQAAAAAVGEARDVAAAQAERAAVDLALRIAEQVVRGAVDASPERVLEAISGALRTLMDRDRVTVLVHPEDLELVRERVGDVVDQLGGIEHCDVQSDRRVARGGAIVRTTHGEVDATIQAKLDRTRELLLEELRG